MNCILRRLSLIIIAALFLFPCETFASEDVRVMVLPFKVKGPEKMAYLKTEITDVLRKHLKNNGALVVESELSWMNSWPLRLNSIERIKTFSFEQGADYVAFGSLEQEEGELVLRIKLLKSFGHNKPEIFYKKAQGIEKLPEMLEQVSSEIAAVIFKIQSIADLFIDNRRIETDAREDVRVMALPFKIKGPEKMAYLKTEIPDVLKKHLKSNGALVVESELSWMNSWPLRLNTIERIKTFGVEKSADYVLFGKLKQEEGELVLIIKLLDLNKDGKSKPFIKKGKGIETLPEMLDQVSREIAASMLNIEIIADVVVTGNKRIETDVVKLAMKTKPWDIYVPKNLSEDLKAIYAMGYFEDIRIESKTDDQGRIITFNLEEKPTIKNILTEGNKVYTDKEIMENITISEGSILNVFHIKKNMEHIEAMYKAKNYHKVNVAYRIEKLDKNNWANLEFVIEEGEKFHVEKIIFKGNSDYTDKKLKDLMKTSEKGFFSWLTLSGEFTLPELNQDISAITDSYHNNGYIQAKVSEPEIKYGEDSTQITITIEEGPRFRVDNVVLEQTALKGDFLFSKQELRNLIHNKLKICEKEYFSRESLRRDVLMLSELYSDKGYASAIVVPVVDVDKENLLTNVKYSVKQGKKVYFEKIIISGNTKTRDKVIRRSLDVHEGEIYSGQGIKKGIRRLYRYDFFEDIKVDGSEGTSDDRINLKIDVTEKSTGAFIFGGGYSNEDAFFGMIQLNQRNLFGRGQTLALKGKFSGDTNKYNLSFTEPWLFDIPLSAGADVYNWTTEYDTYDKDSVGSAVKFGYSVCRDTRAYVSYTYDISDIYNIEDDASSSVEDMEGKHTTSSVKTSLVYDSRDSFFNPTEGSEHRITFQYAGIGGDIAFTKSVGETGWYIPFLGDTVLFFHAKAGYVWESSKGKLPDYELFYLGGMNSVRGFDWQGIHCNEGDDEMGGHKFVQGNVELLIPLAKKAGLMGVLFFDTGNVYNKDEDIRIDELHLRESAGFGIRWYSPLGPMRLERGYILDPDEEAGETSGGDWEFTIGYPF
jgi:outer membrane protein insertion porin family